MKQNRIHIVLPIAISLLLPGINFLSHNTDRSLASYESFIRWGFSSLILYGLWYILLFTTKVHSKYTWLLVAMIIFVFSFLVCFLFTAKVFHIPSNARFQPMVKIIFASILQLVIQYALRASDNIGRLRVEKEQALAEKYKVQLQELRTRVDPHFLFNSLNTLRSMVRQKDPSSEQFVLSLSHLYRQTLKVRAFSTISLSEEMEVLDAYIYLMQQRSRTGVEIYKNINDSFFTYRIPTMSVQTIVENCFKHNRSSVSDPLHIDIYSEGEDYLVVRNNLLPKISVVEKSGYGINNIAKSYELLKVENGIIYETIGDQFVVKLKLLKDERADNRR